MKKSLKSVLAVIISVCMLLTIMPVSVFADGNLSVTFGTGSFNGNTAEYDVDGNHIEITVTGANIVNGTVTVPNGDFGGITFTVSGDFDSSYMRVAVYGENNYRGEPDTNDGWHGRRVNMGAWGNTPYATRTKFVGGVVRVR